MAFAPQPLLRENVNFDVQAFMEKAQFDNGLAPRHAYGLYGYISMRGEWVIRPQYLEAGPFREKLAPVKAASNADKIGYFNLKAQEVYLPTR
jgi:hypothetical protein